MTTLLKNSGGKFVSPHWETCCASPGLVVLCAGYMDLLAQLTVAGDVTEEAFRGATSPFNLLWQDHCEDGFNILHAVGALPSVIPLRPGFQHVLVTFEQSFQLKEPVPGLYFCCSVLRTLPSFRLIHNCMLAQLFVLGNAVLLGGSCVCCLMVLPRPCLCLPSLQIEWRRWRPERQTTTRWLLKVSGILPAGWLYGSTEYGSLSLYQLIEETLLRFDFEFSPFSPYLKCSLHVKELLVIPFRSTGWRA
jgi:hypothetical protein